MAKKSPPPLPTSFTFNMTLKTIPVELVVNEQTTVHAELRELTAAERDGYLNKNKRRFNSDGIRDFQGYMGDLLSLTLWNLETNARYTLNEVQSFPATVQEPLFMAAMQLNGFELPKKLEDKVTKDEDKDDEAGGDESLGE